MNAHLRHGPISLREANRFVGIEHRHRGKVANSPFRRDAQRRALGNAVPLPMGRTLARAIKRAVYDVAEVAS